VQNSVAWRTDVWRLERARTLPVPYFFGRIMRMPAVELRNRSTGRRVWFVNVHNPADKFGTAGGWRAQATALEGELVRRLHAAGSPVVLTGDFNDHAGAFCAIAAIAPVVSADGGTSRAGCEPPADPAIDWIFATRGVQLSDYVRRRGALVRRTTDHPFVYASARIPPTTTRSGS
jgi:endonuclease/exonuclease/phosphatase family metal-dependent hydrolase